MTDREDDFDRTAKDSEGRKVQQELERQLRELGNTMSDSFRHGFEGRGEEIGDRVWDVGRAAVNAAGYGISEAGRAFQAGKQEYQKRAEEARSSAGTSGMTDWARNFFAKKPKPTAIENIRTSAKKRHGAVRSIVSLLNSAIFFDTTIIESLLLKGTLASTFDICLYSASNSLEKFILNSLKPERLSFLHNLIIVDVEVYEDLERSLIDMRMTSSLCSSI